MMIYRVEHNRRRLRMHVHVCESRLERGLVLRRRPAPDTAYLLRNRRTVHTIGTHYPIDVLFCDAQGRIIRIETGLGPCRFAREGRARQVWELCAGGAKHWGWRVGDEIQPC
jgi:uncharacterized membrane protein (UPF0127 family)